MTRVPILNYSRQTGTIDTNISGKDSLTNMLVIGKGWEFATTAANNCGTSNTWIDGNFPIFSSPQVSGVYECSLNILFLQNAATWTSVLCGIATSASISGGNTGNSFTDQDTNGMSNWAQMDVTNIPNNCMLTIPKFRVNVAYNSNDVFLIKIKAVYSAGTPQYKGCFTFTRIF